MNKSILKTPGFWVALVMTNLGLLLANGVFTDGTALQIAGWVMTIATALGYKALSAGTPETPPAA